MFNKTDGAYEENLHIKWRCRKKLKGNDLWLHATIRQILTFSTYSTLKVLRGREFTADELQSSERQIHLFLTSLPLYLLNTIINTDLCKKEYWKWMSKKVRLLVFERCHCHISLNGKELSCEWW